MKKISVIIGFFILCFTMTGCRNKNNVLIKDINAEYFRISYGMSMYESKGKVGQETIDSLVEDYNNIKLIGTTKQEINYDKVITITFINDDKISGQVIIDNKGICRIYGNVENFIISEDSTIYEDALKVYHDLKEKYDS